MKGKPIQLGHRQFPSVRATCQFLNVSESRVYSYAEKLEQSIADVLNYIYKHGEFPSLPKKNVTKVVYQGKSFPSYSALCNYYGIKPSTFTDYKNRHGLTVEETMEHFLNPQENLIEFDGKKFKSVGDICRYYGYSYHAVYSQYYMNQYFDVLDVIRDYIDGILPERNTSVKIGLVTYPSIRSVCKHFSISHDRYYRAVQLKGEQPEKVVSRFVQETFLSKWEKEIRELKQQGMTEDYLCHYYIQTGLNPFIIHSYYQEQCQIPSVKGERVYVQYSYYPNVLIACLHHNLDNQEVQQLVDSGEYSVNGAFTQLLQNFRARKPTPLGVG